jgi:hypothetical protein
MLTIRAREWWNYKLPLALAAAYNLAWMQSVPLHTLWLPLLLLIVGGITAGIFASVFNDLLDGREDRAAGKFTGVMMFSRRGKAMLLLLIEASMLTETWLLAPYRHAQMAFITIWALYTAYSLPPIRLKERGVWGALCIAVGEHLLPALMAVGLVVDTSHCVVPTAWFAALIVWSVAVGLRSILWHQLCDYENDRKTHTKTLGARYDFSILHRATENCVFPIELASLAVLLSCSKNPLAWMLLGVYIALDWARHKYMGVNVIIVVPQPNFRFGMYEYYQLFWPLAFLIVSVRTDATVWLLILVQLLLFPMIAWYCVKHAASLLRGHLRAFIIR